MFEHTYGLTDEQAWDRWVHDPYFQYFTGEELFQHTLPHECSGMSHWRKSIGDRLGILLAKGLRIAHDAGALKMSDPSRVTIDTTVQPKPETHDFAADIDAALRQQIFNLPQRQRITDVHRYREANYLG